MNSEPNENEFKPNENEFKPNEFEPNENKFNPTENEFDLTENELDPNENDFETFVDEFVAMHSLTDTKRDMRKGSEQRGRGNKCIFRHALFDHTKNRHNV